MDLGRYTSYHTIYGFEISKNKEVTGEVKQTTIEKVDKCSIKGSACFSTLYSMFKRNAIDSDSETTVYLKMCKNFVEIESRNNHIIFVKYEDIIFWLEYLKNFVNYEYTIGDDPKDGNYYLLKIVGNFCMGEIKFLTTFIRYLYEKDYSFILPEAIQAYKLKLFGDENIINIYNIISFKTNFYLGSGHGHLISTDVLYKLMSVDQIKKQLKKISDINDLYTKVPTIINNQEYIDLLKLERFNEKTDIRKQLEAVDKDKRFDVYSPKNVKSRFKSYYKHVYELLLKL